jgi:integrase
MPRVKLTKSVIDNLPTPAKEVVYWDVASPGFGLKVTPAGRKVFVVLYRTGGAGSRLRKYTIGPYGRVTLHQARVSAQKVFAARLEGRDLAAEKRAARKRMTVDRVEDLLEAYIAQHVSQNRSARGTSQMLRRELASWSIRSIHEISKRDVIEVIAAVEQRGASVAANKTLKAIKTFLRWCVGRAVLDHSPAEGIPLPTKEVARDRVLTDDELARVIVAAREIGGPYGGIVELLALTGQRREEAARCLWNEIDLQIRIWSLPNLRTKNAKPHIVHLSDQAITILRQAKRQEGGLVFSLTGACPFQDFSNAKRELDTKSGVTRWRLHDLRRTCVSGMAALGVAPHVADKILNHQSGTISGVAAVYQRHQFLSERKEALERWGAHVARTVTLALAEKRWGLNQVA